MLFTGVDAGRCNDARIPLLVLLYEVDDSVNFFLQQLQIEMVHTSTGPLEEVDDSFNFFLQQLQIEMVHTSPGPLEEVDDSDNFFLQQYK